MKRKDIIKKWLKRCNEYASTIDMLDKKLENETCPKEIDRLEHSRNSTINRQAGHLEVLRDLGAFE